MKDDVEFISGVFTLLKLEDAIDLVELSFKRFKEKTPEGKESESELMMIGIITLELSLKISNIVKAKKENISEKEANDLTFKEIALKRKKEINPKID